MADKTAEERAEDLLPGEPINGGLRAGMARAIREAEAAAYERAATAVRAGCAVCEGAGHASADEECPYCGRPIKLIRALKHGDDK